jgi:hypothetical protein
MKKYFVKKQAAGWIASKITKADLKKAKKDGFLAKSTEIVFPGDEIIPHPSEDFRVIFLAFLLRDLPLDVYACVCSCR